MLDALNLVKGAVSERDLVPALTHLAIDDGHIHGFNGRVHISTPCKELKGFKFTVPMAPFLAAVEACEGDPKILQVEGKNVIFIRRGKFGANMPYGPLENFPLPQASAAKKIKVANLLPVLSALRPFIGQDATRAWSASIKFNGSTAIATNNVVLVQAMLKTAIPSMALPVFAVEEMLRLGYEPTTVTVKPNAATFHYTGGLWLRTLLIEEPWPDAGAVLTKAHEGASLAPIPKGLSGAVQQIRPFCPDPKLPLIQLKDGTVSTLQGALSAAIDGFAGGMGVYHADPLTAVLSCALRMGWGSFPRVPWVGKTQDVALKGVLLGIPNV